MFQHTAARRRLHAVTNDGLGLFKVSTHSRPKAAAIGWRRKRVKRLFQHTAARRRLRFDVGQPIHAFSGFNTQPPEGGC